MIYNEKRSHLSAVLPNRSQEIDPTNLAARTLNQNLRPLMGNLVVLQSLHHVTDRILALLADVRPATLAEHSSANHPAPGARAPSHLRRFRPDLRRVPEAAPVSAEFVIRLTGPGLELAPAHRASAPGIRAGASGAVATALTVPPDISRAAAHGAEVLRIGVFRCHDGASSPAEMNMAPRGYRRRGLHLTTVHVTVRRDTVCA